MAERSEAITTCTSTIVITSTVYITLTTTLSVNSSPEQALGEQPAESSSDSTPIIWMSLFIVFLLTTIAAVTISIYLACILKRKRKFKADAKADVTLVQTNLLRKSMYQYYHCNSSNRKSHT